MKVRDIMDSSPDVIRTSDTFERLIKILGEVKFHVGNDNTSVTVHLVDKFGL